MLTCSQRFPSSLTVISSMTLMGLLIVLTHISPSARLSTIIQPSGAGSPLHVFESSYSIVIIPSSLSLDTEDRSEEHTSELQSHSDLVCRLLLEKKKTIIHASHRCNLYTVQSGD